jgi:hypothetical protein
MRFGGEVADSCKITGHVAATQNINEVTRIVIAFELCIDKIANKVAMGMSHITVVA